jgi:signal peptidase I
MTESDKEHRTLIETGFSLLAGGTSLRLSAYGYSMYPSLKPGTIVTIEPVKTGDKLSPGEIIAWKREDLFIIHRLVKIVGSGDTIQYVTRGDSCLYPDLPINKEQIAGRVISAETTGGKIIRIKNKLITPSAGRLNRTRVWIIIKMKAAQKKLFKSPSTGSK